VRIAFYMPFKPLGHPHPSGDLVIGTELFHFLRERGHDIRPVSRLRARWIYWKPWQWALIPIETLRARRLTQQFQPHVWLTYHSYYKAPDVLGAICAPSWGIPYVIFQGVYSTKRRRRMKTKPGFWLNRCALQRASAVFTNKRRDETNLRRLLPDDRLHYIAPGIRLDRFMPAPHKCGALRKQWGTGNSPVILTAAMFRPGVKAEGIARVIRSCGHMADKGYRFRLVICGDGSKYDELKQLATKHLGPSVHFAGRVPRDQMPHYYHSADMFVFPGIQEGLGMVYLEAQSAGLPVVACTGWGAAEVVRHNQTGLLSAPGDWTQFEQHMMRLLSDRELRCKMGEAATQHIARHHDLQHNYKKFETHLRRLAGLPVNGTPSGQNACHT
jgi:glycosyltransferase involved in cell wall biosynthesis